MDVSTPPINHNLASSLNLDEFVIVDQDPITLIKDAALQLSNVPEKYKQNTSSWFSSKNFDSEVLLAIKDLQSYTNLNQDQKLQVKPYLLTAYKALVIICNNQILNPQALKAAEEQKNDINLQCGGVADNLAKLTTYSSVLDLLHKSNDPSQFLIKINSSGMPELTTKINTDDSNNLLDFLQNIKAILNNSNVISHLDFEQLLQLKFTTFWLMANFLKRYESGLDLAEHVFQDLSYLNLQLSQLLSQKSQKEKDAFSNHQILKNLNSLKSHIHANFYTSCKNFWDDKLHVNQLKEFEKYIGGCKAFLSNSNVSNVNSLVFLKRSDNPGIALYQVPKTKTASDASSTEDNSTTLVVFPYNIEGYFSNYNPNQARTTEMELGGLAHQPIVSASGVYWNCLQSLIAKVKQEFPDDFKGKIHLVSAGFGLDGAVAQILSYLWAQQNADSQTSTYCLGTPPYLDVNAARTVQQQANHYAISFALDGDKYLYPSKLNFLIKPYYANNFKGQYTLHYRDWFASDFYKHDKPIYLETIRKGVNHAQMMYDLSHEVDELLQTAAQSNVKELGQNVAKIYTQSFPNKSS